MSVMVEVWGEFACFSRPEMKTERVTFDVITPSAARGLLEAIYWHPGLNWSVDRIYVMAPMRQEARTTEKADENKDGMDGTDIKMTSIKRNEVNSVLSANTARSVMTTGKGDLYLNTAAERNQRSSLILQDVHYVLEAHFDMTINAGPGDNPGKFQDIMNRRLKKGQCYHQPYFGCREFPAHFREWKGGVIPTIPLTKDLGYMLHSMDYSNPADIRPRFFRAQMKDGVLDLRDCEVVM